MTIRKIDNIPIWGDHDELTIAQIRRCAADEHVAGAALMADGHLGYAMPIGGVIAYREAISPNGVGFDISCLAYGTPVTTRNGYWLPIEEITSTTPITCWDGCQVRTVNPNFGMVVRGLRETCEVTLWNGRTLKVTPDHRILTKDGWKEVGELSSSDAIACAPFVGLAHQGQATTIPVSLPDTYHLEQLAARGLFPLRTDSPLFPVVIRLLGYLSGDGHLARTGKRLTIYTSQEEDARTIQADFARIGYPAAVHRRARGEKRLDEIAVYVDSVQLHAFFAALGSPIGRKAWPVDPMPWLFATAPWVRAHFLSAFCSAEMMTPIVRANGRIPNLQLKQAGNNDNAIQFIARLFRSLGFDVSVAQSGPLRDGGRFDSVLQLLGGAAAQVRFVEEIGFCYSRKKRVRGAQLVSVYWQWMTLIENRQNAREEARSLYSAGPHWRTVVDAVAQRYAVRQGFVRHSIYGQRGTPRMYPGSTFVPDSVDEICWMPIRNIAEGAVVPVYDIVTDDPGHAFFAAGCVAHNCGNKAARTAVRADDIRADMGRIMDEVARTVVFGIGRTSGQNTDHPLFDSPTWRDVPRIGKLKELAREQLGTVGSGNHYVDLLEDEEGWLWIGVHFGSRGLGHRICTGFLNLAAGRGWDERSPGESMDAPAVVLPLDGTLGQDYFAAMQLAGQYAYAGRDFVVSQVLDILGTTATDEVHNHHNYCIAGTEKIATPNGAKHILDIQAGDVIYAFDLQDGLVETTVTAQWSSGRKPIYTIATANRKIRVSGDHPILTITSTEAAHPERPWMTKRVGAYQWKAAQDLVVGDIVVCAEGYFAQNETVDDGLPRFIGAFLGDGWMRDEEATKIQGYSLGLAIGNATEAHSQRYLELACSLWPQTNWKNNAKGAFGLSCSDRAVYHRLTALGLNHRSHTRRVPSFAFKLSREQKLELLAGYFDADGSVGDSHTSNYGRGTICSVSAALVADLRELAIGCGLQVTNMRREQRLTNYGNSLVYRCVLSASSTAQLDLWHGRKRANSRTARIDRSRLATQQIGYLPLPKGGFAQRIRTITVTDEEEVFDINIEHPGHAFVCEGMVVHNCWKEQHSGENLYVVRKGATPAFPGQRGFIGGSMGDISVIVEGVAGEEAAAGLHSTIHGAGRVMSRTRAAGKRRWARVNGRRVQQQIRPGEVSPAMMHDWLRREGVELRGGGLDESPHVYRRLPDVLARHAATIRILHTLRPLGVAMAGEDVFDPYKD